MSIFDNPNFKLIDRVVGKASISVTKTGVGFSKQTIAKLNYPHYVQIFINLIDKKFAIRACEENDRNSIKFVNSKKTRVDSVRWNNAEFTKEVNMLVDEKQFEKGYKVDGDYLPEENALIFDFNKAYPIDDNE